MLYKCWYTININGVLYNLNAMMHYRAGNEIYFKYQYCIFRCQLVFSCVLFLLMQSAYGNPVNHGEIPKSSFYSHFSHLSLRNQANEPFLIENLQGKVSLFNFIFTRCSGICPTQTKELVELYQALPESTRQKINFVSFSVDPENDTPEQLNAFAEAFGAKKMNWHFLVASKQQTQSLLQALSLLTLEGEGSNEAIQHQSHLWLVSKQGRLMMKYGGLNIDKKRLVRELTQLTHY